MMNGLPPTFEKFVAEGIPCSHDGCGKPGAYALVIKLWAKGHPKETTPPLRSVFSLRACEEHRYDVKATGFWTPEGKAQIRGALAALGRAEPDFDTAEFEWVEASKALG